jgi:hypothetical protein
LGNKGLRADTKDEGSKDEVPYLVRRGNIGGVVWDGGYRIGGWHRYR